MRDSYFIQLCMKIIQSVLKKIWIAPSSVPAAKDAVSCANSYGGKLGDEESSQLLVDDKETHLKKSFAGIADHVSCADEEH